MENFTIEKALTKLVDGIKSGKLVDQHLLDKYSDGEILTMFLNPILQRPLSSLKDRKGFFKNLTK